jgi:hypothetical protein
MAVEYGLFPEGLRIPTFDELINEVFDELRPDWGDSYDFSSFDPVGQLVRSVKGSEVKCWQALEAVDSSRTREGSSGLALAANLAITGTEWPEATASTVLLILTGDDGTEVTSGSFAKTLSTGAKFEISDDSPLVLVPALAFSSLYSVGVKVASTGGIYVCVVEGTTAASGALTGTGATPITHGTAQFRWAGAGVASASVRGVSVVTGPVVATAGDILGPLSIDTPIGGWLGVTNLEDATLGRRAATDGEARLVGETDIFRPASTVPDAIVQALREIDGVTVVDLLVNVQDITVNGVGPHGVEAIVTGGSDEDIAAVLFRECVPAGIQTYGGEFIPVLDSIGNIVNIRFTRVTDVPIYVAITVEKIANVPGDGSTFPADGEGQVKAAIIAWGNALIGGRNIVSLAVAAQIVPRRDLLNSANVGGVTGVLDVPVCNIGTAPSPSTSTTIVLTRRERGLFAVDRIAVTLTDGTV